MHRTCPGGLSVVGIYLIDNQNNASKKSIEVENLFQFMTEDGILSKEIPAIS